METLRIRTPQSLLRLLPHLVGAPEPPCLVALPFAGGRSGMPMVLDLPDRSAVAATARAVRGGARGADAVVLVACLADPLGTGALPRRLELARVAERLERAGLRVLDALALGPDSWGDYAAPDAARGPLAELDLLDDPAPGVPLPAPIPGAPETGDDRSIAAVLGWIDALGAAEVDAARDDPIAALELAVELAPGLGSGPGALGVDPARAAALAIGLVWSPPVRDLAIELALDGVDAARATLAALDRDGDVAGDAAAARFLGTGPAPDAARLLDRLRRWSAIAEAAPLELRAPVLVIVGFLHFFAGRGRTAGRCAELAMAIDPTLTMAPLLRDIVDAKGAPDWVLRPADPE